MVLLNLYTIYVPHAVCNSMRQNKPLLITTDRNQEGFTIFNFPLPILYIIGLRKGYVDGFGSGV